MVTRRSAFNITVNLQNHKFKDQTMAVFHYPLVPPSTEITQRTLLSKLKNKKKERDSGTDFFLKLLQ